MRYLVFSAGPNGWAIGRGLKQLNCRLVTPDPAPQLVPAGVDPPRPGDTLFFTEEASLARYLGDTRFAFLPQAIAFPLDDKLAFSQVVEAQGDCPVPWWPFEPGRPAPELPILVKGRHSWLDGRKVPRGFLCRTANEFAAVGARIAAAGWTPAEFFLQRWLPDGVINNYSACGFVDHQRPERNLVIVTRKMLASGGGLDEAAGAVITVDDPAGLVERTQTLLTRLDYTGPFEMEFLQDPVTGSFHVLELNPRFWMQHGIFRISHDNGLIRRYLGLDDGAASQIAPKPVLWVSAARMFNCFVTLRWNEMCFYLWDLPFRLARGRTVLIEPSLADLIPFRLRQIVGKRLPWRRRGR